MPDPTLEEMEALIACQSNKGACTPDCPAIDTFCGSMEPEVVAAMIRLLNRVEKLDKTAQQIKEGLEKAASVLEEIGTPPPGLQDLPSVQHYARAMARAARAVLDELR